jgi:hypothetical protein
VSSLHVEWDGLGQVLEVGRYILFKGEELSCGTAIKWKTKSCLLAGAVCTREGATLKTLNMVQDLVENNDMLNSGCRMD